MALALGSEPGFLGCRPTATDPFHLVHSPREARYSLFFLTLKVMAASLAASALVVDGSRTGPRAHRAKYVWEGDVGPVDWGDAITTTSCRLTDKSRIGSGGLADFLPSQACRH